MSRKGNKPISIPNGVNITVTNDMIQVKGSNGTINISYPAELLAITVDGSNVNVAIKKVDDKAANIFHGTISSHIVNAIIGVSKGFFKTLKIVGVGYKASVSGKKLVLAIGFSHPVELMIPSGLKVVCPVATQIDISGFNKQEVGQFTAVVRSIRPPEPYNGKGIMYSDEILIRKVGKTAESSAGSTPAAGGAKAGAAKGGAKK
ncbi:MAG: 50S ribosomal protein L6 [Mycoplasmataceae bacterium]|jgi:large subunit ribosomal protein L6|nr:50S ribosomal protein L6 [Mycoplasmataceae bacterium]